MNNQTHSTAALSSNGAGLRSQLAKAIRHPGKAFDYAMARFRGEFYRLYYALTRPGRFFAGAGLQVRGPLIIKGPGRVSFGHGVRVSGRVTPWTHSAIAEIRVGDFSELGGTRFGCAERITIGRNCMISDCHILDTDFHPMHTERDGSDAKVRVAPVEIGDNVWIAGLSGILPGTSIGKDSVVAFGAVCSGAFGEGVLIAGNPARTTASVPGANPDKTTPATPTPAGKNGKRAKGSHFDVRELVARTFRLPVEAINNELSYNSVEEWDSFGHLVLIDAIAAEYNVEITDEMVIALSNVGAIREFVDSLAAQAR